MSAEMDVEANDPKNIELQVSGRKNEPNEIEPTTEELNTLEHISDRIPFATWLIVVCEFCERFAFLGMTGPFQNYMQFPERGPNDTQPGALNLGQAKATALSTFFQFFCYLTPILGAIVADQYLGKYRTIFVGCVIYLVGLLVLVLTSIPLSINAGVGVPGLIVAMVIIGIATGGVKSNVSPLMADQCTRKTPIVRGKIISLEEKIHYKGLVFRNQR